MKDGVFSFAFGIIALRAKLSVGVSLVVLSALLLASCTGKLSNQANPTAAPAAQPDRTQEEAPATPSSGWDLAPQIDSGGQVTIEVAPLALGEDVWEFKVALNTHSVDLGFDLTEVSTLRCDRGQEFEAAAWDGSGPGGHHRSGVLRFAALDHPTSTVEVVIRDVAKVPERVFRWDVPGEAGLPADTNVTQSSTPMPPSTSAGGMAKVTLSDREFDLGNVVMRKGIVRQTMEITNEGNDVLRIEGVYPT
jgi:hypothetical protein